MTQPDRALLLSAEANQLANESQARSTLLSVLVANERLAGLMRGHAAAVNSVAFSPDGTTLASASVDRTIRLWDVARRQPLGEPLSGHSYIVNSVAFSPDGTTLASASYDGTMRLWEMRVESWIARACRIVGRNLTQDEWNQFVSPDLPYHRTCPDIPSGEGAPANAP
jgi:WD40 repeat protein